ncbi:MAG: hypothetical protein AAGC92_14735 [Pseudomonadota bacterium]
MTDRTSSEKIQRVSDEENSAVHGMALAHKALADGYMKEIHALRARQEAYEDSLPKEPGEAWRAIALKLLDLEDFGAPQFAARAALEIIYALAACRRLEDNERLSRSVAWLAEQGLTGLEKIEQSCDEARTIASHRAGGGRFRA